MKFNKWTLGLAAVGVVSLASVAKAEEKMSAVQSALSSTTISGYVDVSAQWNLGTGNENNPPYKFGGAGKADGFNLNVVQLTISKPLDEAEWASGYRADLWFGPDAASLGTQSTLHDASGEHSSRFSDFAIRQAYVALRMPIGNGLDWKIGVFDTIIGYESIESGNNPNYSRSYGHSIEPQTHTGLLATYRFNDMVSVAAGIANTKGPIINARAHGEDGKAESAKTYMASIALTAPTDWGWAAGSTLYGGVVHGFDDNEHSYSDVDGNSTSYYAGGTLATPVAGLKVGGSFDYLHVANSGSYDYAWAVAAYASYQATEKLSVHGRAEYFKDKYDYLGVNYSGDSAKVLAFTATVQYDLWKNVISRLEFRWDHAATGNNAFGSSTTESGSPNRKDAFMVAANVIYKF